MAEKILKQYRFVDLALAPTTFTRLPQMLTELLKEHSRVVSVCQKGKLDCGRLM